MTAGQRMAAAIISTFAVWTIADLAIHRDDTRTVILEGIAGLAVGFLVWLLTAALRRDEPRGSGGGAVVLFGVMAGVLLVVALGYLRQPAMALIPALCAIACLLKSFLAWRRRRVPVVRFTPMTPQRTPQPTPGEPVDPWKSQAPIR